MNKYVDYNKTHLYLCDNGQIIDGQTGQSVIPTNNDLVHGILDNIRVPFSKTDIEVCECFWCPRAGNGYGYGDPADHWYSTYDDFVVKWDYQHKLKFCNIVQYMREHKDAITWCEGNGLKFIFENEVSIKFVKDMGKFKRFGII